MKFVKMFVGLFYLYTTLFVSVKNVINEYFFHRWCYTVVHERSTCTDNRYFFCILTAVNFVS